MRWAASGDETLEGLCRDGRLKRGDAALPKNRQQDGSVALGNARTVLYIALLLLPICHELTCTLWYDGVSQWPTTWVCGNITQVKCIWYQAVIFP
jgi:hypothetical protein